MSKWKQVSSLVRNKAIFSLLPTRYTFIPNKDEVIESRFRLRYSTTCNSYYRDWSDIIDPASQAVIPGWDKALFSVDSVHRHIDEEAGQVYLERVPGSSTGCIKWRFDFGCCGLLVDEVTIRLSCVEDFGGEVVVTLAGNPGQQRLRYPAGSDYVTYTEMENTSQLTLTIHFVGEAGQITQLFPQSILRGMGYPLDIQVILKPPLQSLGRPRILVGLLYSSSQEIQVDSRHYKKNTNSPGRGFLHIHLLRGRDFPYGKHGTPEAFTKCYLLPDGKKTTKCRTKARKGRDPMWNEQFLLVGVNYHDIKRRALEICVADSNTQTGRKAHFLGGVRLSLGHKAIAAAQTKNVSKVLEFLKAKGGADGGAAQEGVVKKVAAAKKSLLRKVSFSDKDTIINNLNSASLRKNGVTEKNDETDEKDKEETDHGAGKHEENAAVMENESSADKREIDIKEAKHEVDHVTSTTDSEETEKEQSVSSTSTEDFSEGWDLLASDSTPDSPVECFKTSSIKVESKVSFSSFTSQSKTDIGMYTVQQAAASTKESFNSYESQTRAMEVSEKSYQVHVDSTSVFESQVGTKDVSRYLELKKQQVFVEKDREDGNKDSTFFSCDDITEELSRNKTLQGKDDRIADDEKHEALTMTLDNWEEQENNDFKDVLSPENTSYNDAQNELNAKKENNVIREEIQIRIPVSVTVGNSLVEEKTSSNSTHDENTHPKSEATKQEKETLNKMDLKPVVERGKLKSDPVDINARQQDIVGDRAGMDISAVTDDSRAETSDLKRSPSFSLKDIGKRLSCRKPKAAGKENGETGIDSSLGANVDKLMMDGEGLEITQWQHVVEKPNQWHYCWQILRLEMSLLH